MRVRCISKGYSGITFGRIYNVVDSHPTSNTNPSYKCIYTIIDNYEEDANWYSTYFEVVCDTLPNGWHYCKCGATTSNADLCCECKTCK